MASQDADGDYRIVGRKSVDIIKTGGFKVSAREIEDVLRSHSLVDDVAVVGVEDAEWGQRIVAFVVPIESPSNPDQTRVELIEWTESRLAGFKKPKEVIFIGELPRNALGKVQKHHLQRSGRVGSAD